MKTPAYWLAKYYPEPASEAAKRSWVDALEHSIRKWTGLRKKALGPQFWIDRAGDLMCGIEPVLEVSTKTCAMCQRAEAGGRLECSRCPLALARGGVHCDRNARGEDLSPYAAFTEHRDPEPMLALLRSARKIAKKLDKEGK